MMKVMWVTQGIPRGASDIWLGTHSDASVWCSICTWHRHEKAHNDCNAEFYHTVVHLCRFQKVSDKILWHQKRASTICIHTSNDPHTTHNKSGTKVGPHLCSVIYQYIFYLLLNGIIRIAAGSSFQKLEKQVASSYQSKRATIFLIIAYLLLFREKTFFNCIAG